MIETKRNCDISECPLDVTQKEFDAFSQAEAVVVREYETDNGRRFARVVAWGDLDEMKDQADALGLYVVPVGVRIICQRAILLKDLIHELPKRP